MDISLLIISWMVRCTFICFALNGMTVSARYQYPGEPDIDFTKETNRTCPYGCSICSDIRYVCTKLKVHNVPQIFPATIQYLQLTDIPWTSDKPTALDVQNNSFKRYPNLRYLDISDNHIKNSTIPEGTFGELKKLEYLKIRQSGIINYNYFNNFPRSLKDMTLCGLGALKYLDLRGNNRLGLNKIIYRLKALAHTCRKCTMDYLDLSYTNDLDAEGATIQSFMLKISEMVIFKRLNVKVLKLDGNHISSIEQEFGAQLSSLEYFSLRANFISLNFIDYGNIFYCYNFLVMYNLKVLDIGGNAHLPIKVGNPVYKHAIPGDLGCLSLPTNLDELYLDNTALLNERIHIHER